MSLAGVLGEAVVVAEGSASGGETPALSAEFEATLASDPVSHVRGALDPSRLRRERPSRGVITHVGVARGGRQVLRPDARAAAADVVQDNADTELADEAPPDLAVRDASHGTRVARSVGRAAPDPAARGVADNSPLDPYLRISDDSPATLEHDTSIASDNTRVKQCSLRLAVVDLFCRLPTRVIMSGTRASCRTPLTGLVSHDSTRGRKKFSPARHPGRHPLGPGSAVSL